LEGKAVLRRCGVKDLVRWFLKPCEILEGGENRESNILCVHLCMFFFLHAQTKWNKLKIPLFLLYFQTVHSMKKISKFCGSKSKKAAFKKSTLANQQIKNPKI
jgi:hypothetical protein